MYKFPKLLLNKFIKKFEY